MLPIHAVSAFRGVVTGAAVIFFAYIGFDAVSTAAQEAKNPQRDMPIGILGSLAICTVLYILVAGIMVGLVDYKLLTNAAAPIAVAIDAALAAGAGHDDGNDPCASSRRSSRSVPCSA